MLVGADTLPEPTAIEHLVQPFADPSVGMTGARVIPLNTPTTWLGFTVQMLWHVHHQLALRKPKLGELVAFRNVIDDFPEDTSTDEPAIEALIAAKGYRLVYAPKAVVYNRGPERRERVPRAAAPHLRRPGAHRAALRLLHLVAAACGTCCRSPSRRSEAIRGSSSGPSPPWPSSAGRACSGSATP